ncbi:MAG: XRE family transcriptional regulator [Acidobacteria bacterium]|nr:XRE family transcriptional regulator [Acidobacteriota bacterium]
MNCPDTNPDDFELVHGSGNVYRDFAVPDADLRQAKAIVAARIVQILDEEGLSTRQAAARTGVPQADFSRIRNVRLERFTIDRLMTALNKLGRQVTVQVSLGPMEAA